jgi:hypothetical protein
MKYQNLCGELLAKMSNLGQDTVYPFLVDIVNNQVNYCKFS